MEYLQPKEYLKVTIIKMQKENSRKIVFEAIGESYTKLEGVLSDNEGVGY